MRRCGNAGRAPTAEQPRDHASRIRTIENTVTSGLARIDARLAQIEKELAK